MENYRDAIKIYLGRGSQIQVLVVNLKRRELDVKTVDNNLVNNPKLSQFLRGNVIDWEGVLIEVM